LKAREDEIIKLENQIQALQEKIDRSSSRSAAGARSSRRRFASSPASIGTQKQQQMNQWIRDLESKQEKLAFLQSQFESESEAASVTNADAAAVSSSSSSTGTTTINAFEKTAAPAGSIAAHQTQRRKRKRKQNQAAIKMGEMTPFDAYQHHHGRVKSELCVFFVFVVGFLLPFVLFMMPTNFFAFASLFFCLSTKQSGLFVLLQK
jgi:Tfp pilus assembly protein FimV